MRATSTRKIFIGKKEILIMSYIRERSNILDRNIRELSREEYRRMAIVGANRPVLSSGAIINLSPFRDIQCLWEVERTLGAYPITRSDRFYYPSKPLKPRWNVYVLLRRKAQSSEGSFNTKNP
jgi:hypothetical protein